MSNNHPTNVSPRLKTDKTKPSADTIINLFQYNNLMQQQTNEWNKLDFYLPLLNHGKV